MFYTDCRKPIQWHIFLSNKEFCSEKNSESASEAICKHYNEGHAKFNQVTIMLLYSTIFLYEYLFQIVQFTVRGILIEITVVFLSLIPKVYYSNIFFIKFNNHPFTKFHANFIVCAKIVSLNG